MDRVEQLKLNGNWMPKSQSQGVDSQLNCNDLEQIDSDRYGRLLFLRNKMKNEK